MHVKILMVILVTHRNLPNINDIRILKLPSAQ